MLTKELTEELESCLAKQFPDEGVYRISRVEEWLATNGYTLEKLGFGSFRELIAAVPELFGTPRYNQDSYVIVRHCRREDDYTHPADSFFGKTNSINLNDDIVEMSQQSLYALTKVLGNGLTVQEMKQEIYDSFDEAKEENKLVFISDRYEFPIDYCRDGFLVKGIITKNLSPRGKSLYFSFEKTGIFSSTAIDKPHIVHDEPELTRSDKAEIYKLLTANFPFDEPQHMAAVSKLLADHGFDRNRLGFIKMKDMLSKVEYLDLNDVVLGGVPQIMVTLRRSSDYTASEYSASRTLWNIRSAAYSAAPTERPSYIPRSEIKPAPMPDVNSDGIPLGDLEDFCNLPPKPLLILAQYLENGGKHYSTVELRQAISEDFASARAEGRTRTFENKIIFPLRWKRADGSPVEITIKPSTYDGKPWFLSFVDTVVRDPAARTLQPGQRLENFAFLGSWSAFLSELAEKAIYESWDFAGSLKRDHYILIQYIKYTFYRLIRENKVCISNDRQFACFNTGLVDKHYDDIYACFLPNDPGSETEWKFSGFCTAASRTLGKQVVTYFNPLPQPPKYFSTGDQLFYDVTKPLLTDFDHIIIDNVSRLPVEFLCEQFYDAPEALAAAEGLRNADYNRKHEIYVLLKTIITENSRLFIRIQNRLKDSIELAKKRVSRNYKTAIPSYYPKRNSMSLMLPLCLVDEETPDIALVVEKTLSGNYQGQTILTLPQAYIDARLLCRLNSEWLTTNVLAEESDDTAESESDSDRDEEEEIDDI